MKVRHYLHLLVTVMHTFYDDLREDIFLYFQLISYEPYAKQMCMAVNILGFE